MARPTTRLHVRVSPGAARTGVTGRFGAAWKVRVAAAPDHGKANRAVLDLLSEALRIPRTDVELVSGGSARDKVVAVHGIDAGRAERRLEAASEGST